MTSFQIGIPVKIETIGGQCPVVAEGTIGKKRWRFKSRWNKWVFVVGTDIERPDWQHIEEWPGKPGDAGYISVEDATALIERAAKRYYDDL